MASALSAARTLGQISGWSLTNLEMQKILYIAQMYHLGQTGRPLFDDYFSAWAYGPVLPKVYHKLKMFGANKVRDVLYEPMLADGPEKDRLKEIYEQTKGYSSGKLVSITHWDGGAWAKHYRPGGGGIIPNDDIRREYLDRLERTKRRAAQPA